MRLAFSEKKENNHGSFSTPLRSRSRKAVATLSKELAALRKAVAKRGGAYYEDGRDRRFGLLWAACRSHQRRAAAIRKQGRAIEKTARDHPATAAAVGLVVVGLVASLLLSRR
jgi:ElaB/YqjD/DUF883 family membrane-anchored ribosome-binding protein